MEPTDEIQIVYDNVKPAKRPDGRVHLANEYLSELEQDFLYHLAIDTKSHDLKSEFGDVKFVCMGGTVKRMRTFAQKVADELGIEGPLIDISETSGRYSMFKVGPVLSISHGMGVSSLSILLHEVFKLVYYAQCTNVTFFRIGTSGGIGVPPGTVVISQNVVDELLRPYYELHILGKIVRRPSIIDQDLIQELKHLADLENKPYSTVLGTTMCAMDFYESQHRLDGAICTITKEEKMERMKQLQKAGVVNIEMEAITFASLCHYAGIPCAIVCVTLVNRLDGDQVESNKPYLEELQKRPQELVLKFIKNKMKLNNGTVHNETNGYK